MYRDTWYIIPHQGEARDQVLKTNIFSRYGYQNQFVCILQSEMHNSPETQSWYTPFYGKGDPGQIALQTAAVTVKEILAKIHEFLNSGAMEFPGLLKVISIHVSAFWWLTKC